MIRGQDNLDQHKQESKRGGPSKEIKQKNSTLKEYTFTFVSWLPGAEAQNAPCGMYMPAGDDSFLYLLEQELTNGGH